MAMLIFCFIYLKTSQFVKFAVKLRSGTSGVHAPCGALKQLEQTSDLAGWQDILAAVAVCFSIGRAQATPVSRLKQLLQASAALAYCQPSRQNTRQPVALFVFAAWSLPRQLHQKVQAVAASICSSKLATRC